MTDRGLSGKDIYKVIAGAFKNRNNAQQLVEMLRTKRIDAFITNIQISGETIYRVQSGAFNLKENAERTVKELAIIGINDAYIIHEKNTKRSVPEIDEWFSIKGDSYLSANVLENFVMMMNSSAIRVANYYLKYGEVYGIRGDVAFAQAILETDYFRFTGTVRKEQNNFAGIGTTSRTTRGNHFSTPEEGVHAQIQHLFAYASTEKIPDGFPLIDPRFHLVERGSARAWVDLNGKWAVPGTSYGQTILSIYRRMVNFFVKGI